MYDAKLSSRSVIHDSAGSAGRTMAEDLENPEDKVRDNTISVRRSKQFMRTVTAPARSPRRTSHRHRVHRLGGGCAASRAPATHGRGRLAPIKYYPPRFRNCGARSPEALPAPAQGRVAVAAVAVTAAAAAAAAARAHTQVLGVHHGHRRLAQRHRGVEAHARDRPAAWRVVVC